MEDGSVPTSPAERKRIWLVASNFGLEIIQDAGEPCLERLKLKEGKLLEVEEAARLLADDSCLFPRIGVMT